MKCLNEFFIDCLISYGRNPYLLKVRDNATLKDMKDELNQINQELNPEDIRRVEDVQYGQPVILQLDKKMLTVTT